MSNGDRTYILKVVPGHLHHTAAVLNDGYFWGQEHLSCSIKKTIDRLPGKLVKNVYSLDMGKS
jgi:hypothetical protein